MRLFEPIRSCCVCVRWLRGGGTATLLLAMASLGVAVESKKNLFHFRAGLVGSAEIVRPASAVTTTWYPGDLATGTAEMLAVPTKLPDGSELTWVTDAKAGLTIPVQFSVDHRVYGTRHEIGEGTVQDIATDETWQGQRLLQAPMGILVSINRAKRTYSVHVTFNLPAGSAPAFVRHTTTVRKTGNRWAASATETTNEDAGIGRAYRDKPQVLMDVLKVENLALPESGPLTGTQRIPVPKPDSWEGTWDAAWEFSWALDTSLPPLELVVTSPEYAAWRPTAAPGPNAGAPLSFRAELKSLDGAPPLLKVTRFEWELRDTSREPGIALNFPLASRDASPDLKLVASARQTAQGAEGQMVVTENPPGYVDTMKAESFDWGGWATLQVRAILEDGSVVQGRLGAGSTDILLPRRAETSRIADTWKAKHSAKAGDEADDETTKVGVPNAPGDGFTLYEEYRGFYERGKHLEGDPAKKDFFVLNLIGPGGQAGIDLFEDLSELRVHSRLRPNEMSERERLMNGNHGAGAHRVAQHGVWIKTMSSQDLEGDGAVTVMNQAGVSGRPGLVKGIGILPSSGEENLFSNAYNLPARDAIFAYDRGVAHELMHSIGAEHHGKIGYDAVFVFQFADERSNPLHKPVLLAGGTLRDFAYIIGEKTGEDWATKVAPEQEASRQRIKNDSWSKYLSLAQASIDSEQAINRGKEHEYVEDMAQFMLDENARDQWQFYVGQQHGADSGDEQCIMRYYFSELYPKRGDIHTFYLIPGGTDRIGLQLCTSPAGTGINAEGHRPQSRFGAAAVGCGNCAAQISPNDAVPPRKI